MCSDQMFEIWKQCIACSFRVTEQLRVDAKVTGWIKVFWLHTTFEGIPPIAATKLLGKAQVFFFSPRKRECRIPERSRVFKQWEICKRCGLWDIILLPHQFRVNPSELNRCEGGSSMLLQNIRTFHPCTVSKPR